MMLGKMVGEEPRLIERFHLLQAILVELKQRHIGQMLNVIEYTKSNSAHGPFLVRSDVSFVSAALPHEAIAAVP